MKIYTTMRKTWLVVGGLLGLFTACSETDYMTYDAAHSGIYFTRDTLAYSFGVTPVTQRTVEYKFPVRVMGVVSGTARKFSFEIITDSTTAVEGVQFLVGDPVIPADTIDGYIPVTLLRDGLEGDYQHGFVRYKLGLRLLPGNGFEPTLDSAAQVRVLTFDNAVEQPEWYSATGEKVWPASSLGVWHPLKLIKMVEYFHAMEEVQPDIYDEMSERFGENLENVPYGDFHPYSTVMKKYVYQPMYDYFNAAENRDEILSLYPDFPFDFPNPFPVN